MIALELPPSFRRALASFPLILCAAGALAQVAGLDSLASFGKRGPYDGLLPTGPVLFDTTGNLYGVTEAGGAGGAHGGLGGGIVYRMSKKQDGTWARKTLFDFTSVKDYSPAGRLALDTTGNLYGTTGYGGIHSAGAVYQLVATESGRWKRKVLFNFPANSKQFSRVSGVLRDGAGNLFAGISTGSKDVVGAVFEISPGVEDQWTATEIVRFDSSQGGVNALTMDTAGNLYGVTANSKAGGLVFRLAPPAAGKTVWAYTNLHTFLDQGADGRFANSVVLDTVGNVYGTTSAGGAFNGGTVFEVPRGQEANGADVILYNFNGMDGNGAYSPVGITFEPSGNLVGVTFYGGPPSPNGGVGGGKAFEMIPDKGAWKVRALHNFGSIAVYNPAIDDYNFLDGFLPDAPLVVGPDGNYYGVTASGGYADAQAGTVFKLTVY